MRKSRAIKHRALPQEENRAATQGLSEWDSQTTLMEPAGIAKGTLRSVPAVLRVTSSNVLQGQEDNKQNRTKVGSDELVSTRLS